MASVPRKRGRTAFVATEAQRAEVRRLTGEGATHQAIADAIGISVPTLRKAFRGELTDKLGDANLFTAAGDRPAPSKPAKRRPATGGRKPYKPAERDREKVAVLVATGSSVAEIARAIDLTEPTVRKHFAEEIATAAARKRADVVQALFKTAMKGNVTAQRTALELIDRATLAKLDSDFRGGAKPDADGKDDPVGKKIQADLDARTAHKGTSWDQLLN